MLDEAAHTLGTHGVLRLVFERGRSWLIMTQGSFEAALQFDRIQADI